MECCLPMNEGVNFNPMLMIRGVEPAAMHAPHSALLKQQAIYKRWEYLHKCNLEYECYQLQSLGSRYCGIFTQIR